MVDTIYIARHGFRMNWVTNDWKSVTGLARDPPLAALGETQAQELANYFLSLPEDERPTAIFSSPFYRCLQTTQPTSKALKLSFYVEHGLSEWYSPVKPGTGLHPRPASASVLQGYFPEIDSSWSSVWFPTRKGETVEDVHNRAGDCLETLLHTLESKFPGKHRKILLVSHAATVIALTRELVGDRELPLRAGCCSISIFKRKPNAQDAIGAWDPALLVDGKHLAQGALRDWGFEDIAIENGQVIHDLGVPGSEHEEEGPVGCQVDLDRI